MQIKKIDIIYTSKGSFSSNTCNGMCHKKILPYLSIVQAIEGSYDIQLDNGITYNTGNSGFFIAPSNVVQNIVHNTDSTSKKINCRWIFIKIRVNDIYNFDEKFSFPTILPENLKSEMSMLFDKLFCSTNPFDEYIYYYQIIKLLFGVANEREHLLPPHIEQALRYIKDNYNKKMSIESIAKHANLSASYLFATFKKQMGVSPISFLNNYRLSVAAEQLQETSKSISQISSDIGIDDSIYFNKIFKKHFYMPPSKYREIYKNGKE